MESKNELDKKKELDEKNRKELEKEKVNYVSKQAIIEMFSLVNSETKTFSYSSIYKNLLANPKMINKGLKVVNNDSRFYSSEDIAKFVANPLNATEELVSISNYLEATNSLYKRMILQYSQNASFDLEIDDKHSVSPEEMEKPTYKKDRNKIHDFLGDFDYRREFRKIARMLYRQEAVFVSVIEDEKTGNLMLQQLPQKYCVIDGNSPLGITFSFDLQYFIDNVGTVDINMYPKILKEKLSTLNEQKQGNYNPSADTKKRIGRYNTTIQLRPEDGFYVFKMFEEQATIVPFFSPMFTELSLKPYMQELQKNQYIAEANRMIVGLVDLNKSMNGTNDTNSLKLTVSAISKFVDSLREGINSSIGVGVAPFDDLKEVGGNDGGDTSVVKNYNQDIAYSSGSTMTSLYKTSALTQAESNYNIAIEELMSTLFYPTFEGFMEFCWNRFKNTKTKYEFKAKFVGTENNRDARMKETRDNLTSGIVDIQKIASSCGLNEKELMNRVHYGRSLDIYNLFIPLMTANVMSGKDGVNVDTSTTQTKEITKTKE